jgi:predicted RNase H-like HicB family nuclease
VNAVAALVATLGVRYHLALWRLIMNSKHRQAGLKAAETKGPEERTRAAFMANWTRKHGKDDAKNPYSRQNYTLPHSSSVRDAPTRRASTKNYIAVVERSPETGFYIGFIPGFPGAHSQAETLDELNANLREVIEMLLEDGEPVVESEFVGTQLVRVG